MEEEFLFSSLILDDHLYQVQIITVLQEGYVR